MASVKETYRNMSRQEKFMVLFIILLIIGIITRWTYIRNEVTESVQDRFRERNKTEFLPAPSPETEKDQVKL